MASWVNALQELAESTPLGIPVVMVSNPRNHVADTKIFGVAEAADQMSQWPGELGLAATQDPGLVEEFGRNPQPLLDALRQGLVSEADLDRCVGYLLTEIYELGLFENPYVDPDEAQAVADDDEIQALADEAHRRSMVLLRNDRGVLPLGGGVPKESGAQQEGRPQEQVRLCVEVFTGTEPEQETARIAAEVADALNGSGVSVVHSLNEATHALLWVRPAMSLLNDKPDRPLSVALDAETGIDAARVVEIVERLPTILAVNFTNPWLLDMVAPRAAAAVVATFGVLTGALADLLRGLVTPRGRLPYTISADNDAVLAKDSDIPGADEPQSYAYTDATGARYAFGYGLDEF